MNYSIITIIFLILSPVIVIKTVVWTDNIIKYFIYKFYFYKRKKEKGKEKFYKFLDWWKIKYEYKKGKILIYGNLNLQMLDWGFNTKDKEFYKNLTPEDKKFDEKLILPENMIIFGDVTIDKESSEIVKCFPKKLIINGDLLINGNLEMCYDDLIVYGYVKFTNYYLKNVLKSSKSDNNINKIKIGKLILENINIDKIDFFDFRSIDLNNVEIKKFNRNEALDKYFNDIKYCIYENNNNRIKTKNILNYYSPNSLCSKLLEEKYDLITNEEIQNYLYNSKHDCGEGTIIDYCNNKRSMEFIAKKGYKFTKKELNSINELNYKLKTLYEFYLLKQNLMKTINEDKKNYIKNKINDILNRKII